MVVVALVVVEVVLVDVVVLAVISNDNINYLMKMISPLL